MIIKKKTTKKVETQKTSNTTKSKPTTGTNRGRPRKEFKPKHKRMQIQENVQQETKTRIILNKIPSVITHKMPKVSNMLQLPNKDRSIFYLFIFSVVLFILSLGISFIKESKKQELLKAQEAITGQTAKLTEILQGDNETESIKTTAQQTLQNFYQMINTKDFTNMNTVVDWALSNWNIFRTYFNTKRLTRFVSNLKEGTIYVTDIKGTASDNANISNLNYTLNYTLTTDNTTYTENRSASIAKRDDIYKVAKIKCETAWCSRMPFFNPGKYNLK